MAAAEPEVLATARFHPVLVSSILLRPPTSPPSADLTETPSDDFFGRSASPAQIDQLEDETDLWPPTEFSAGSFDYLDETPTAVVAQRIDQSAHTDFDVTRPGDGGTDQWQDAFADDGSDFLEAGTDRNPTLSPTDPAIFSGGHGASFPNAVESITVVSPIAVAPAKEGPTPVDSMTSRQATSMPGSTSLPRQIPYSLPPRASSQAFGAISPAKRATSNYLPPSSMTGVSSGQLQLAPLSRSYTISPAIGVQYGYGPRATDMIPRPASTHSALYLPTTANSTKQPQWAGHATIGPQGLHYGLDGLHTADPIPRPASVHHMGLRQSPGFNGDSQQDPLQRLNGAPIISWGVGGALVSSFPKEFPRYQPGQSPTVMQRCTGEVRIRYWKEVQPLDDHLAKFPGPLKGKAKKKDVLAWLTTGIDGMETSLDISRLTLHSQVPHDRRPIERLLLWKIIRVFIESDGVLEGSPTVDKSVRDILLPGLSDQSFGYPTGDGRLALQVPASSPVMTEGSVMENIRSQLMLGDREKAVWQAVYSRLWAHALLMANSVSPELYAKVAQEFIRKEVSSPGRQTAPLAALYNVLSGNFEESVAEIGPAARSYATVPFMAAAGPSSELVPLGPWELDKWQETLCLILSNRTTGDARALKSLGSLLSSYGRVEAAHICFIFGRAVASFGDTERSPADFVVVGADHRSANSQFAKDLDALLLSEVYDYGLSLSSATGAGSPHLAAYKLQHAIILAEAGFADRALQYCDALLSPLPAQTRQSLGQHPFIEAAVEDFAQRVRRCPGGESTSWISKPSMNKVSDTMWNRFNKFVAGDDQDNRSTRAAAGTPETGPFARITATPGLSRSPSSTYLESQSAIPLLVPNVAMPPSRAASRYAAPYQSTGSPMQYEPSASVAYQPIVPAAVQHSPHDAASAYADMPPASSAMYPGSGSQVFSAAAAVAPVHPAQMAGYQPGGYQPTGYQPTGYQPTGYQPAGYQPTEYQPTGSQPAGFGHPPSSGTPADTTTTSASYAPPAYLPGVPVAWPYMPYNSQSLPAGDAMQAAGSMFVDTLASQTPSSHIGAHPLQDDSQQQQRADTDSYSTPPYQSYYRPDSYAPPAYEIEDLEGGDETPSKKAAVHLDDEDDMPTIKPSQNSKEENDRKADEAFRKAAADDDKRNDGSNSVKRGWGFGLGWLASGKPAKGKDATPTVKPITAKLGEASSFYYDPDLKRWVNKKAGASGTPAEQTPPPPWGSSRSYAGTPPRSFSPQPVSVSPPPGYGRASAPPPATSHIDDPSPLADHERPVAASRPPLPATATLMRTAPMQRSASAVGPASEPGLHGRPKLSGLMYGNSLDNLLGAIDPSKMPRKARPRHANMAAK